MSLNVNTPDLRIHNGRKGRASDLNELEILSSIKKTKRSRKMWKNMEASPFKSATKEMDESGDIFDNEPINPINNLFVKRKSPLKEYNHQLFESTRISSTVAFLNLKDRSNLKRVSFNPSTGESEESKKKLAKKNKRRKVATRWTEEILDNSLETSEETPTPKNNNTRIIKMSDEQQQYFFQAKDKKKLKNDYSVIEISSDEDPHESSNRRVSKKSTYVLENRQSKTGCKNDRNHSDSASSFNFNETFKVEGLEPKVSESVNKSRRSEFKNDPKANIDVDMNVTFEVDQSGQDESSDGSDAVGLAGFRELPKDERLVEKKRNTYEVEDCKAEVLNVTFERNEPKNFNFNMSGFNSIIDEQVTVDLSKSRGMKRSRNSDLDGTFVTGLMRQQTDTLENVVNVNELHTDTKEDDKANSTFTLDEMKDEEECTVHEEKTNKELRNDVLRNSEVAEISKDEENFGPTHYMLKSTASITEFDNESPFKQNDSNCCASDAKLNLRTKGLSKNDSKSKYTSITELDDESPFKKNYNDCYTSHAKLNLRTKGPFKINSKSKYDSITELDDESPFKNNYNDCNTSDAKLNLRTKGPFKNHSKSKYDSITELVDESPFKQNYNDSCESDAKLNIQTKGPFKNHYKSNYDSIMELDDESPFKQNYNDSCESDAKLNLQTKGPFKNHYKSNCDSIIELDDESPFKQNYNDSCRSRAKWNIRTKTPFKSHSQSNYASITGLNDDSPFKQNYNDCYASNAKLNLRTKELVKNHSKSKYASSEKVKPTDLANNSVRNKKSSVRKMPNFALMHQKLLDKMEDISQYSQRKHERAQLLLSGIKPNSSVKKVDSFVTKRKPGKCDKDLAKLFDQKSASVAHTIVSSKIPLRIATPSEGIAKNVAVAPVKSSGALMKPLYTKFGFKMTQKQTREEVKTIINKTTTVKNTVKKRRDLIQGVRSNRRFDLLMKMRNK